MKERIKQLAVEAGMIVGEPNGFDMTRLMPKEVKFAELIVMECIGIVENLSPGYKDYRDQIEDAFRRDCVIEIKKRFGVE